MENIEHEPYVDNIQSIKQTTKSTAEFSIP